MGVELLKRWDVGGYGGVLLEKNATGDYTHPVTIGNMLSNTKSSDLQTR
jgi:hypothetical protein